MVEIFSAGNAGRREHHRLARAPRRTSSRSAPPRTSAPASPTAAASRTPAPTTRTTSSTSQAAGRRRRPHQARRRRSGHARHRAAAAARRRSTAPASATPRSPPATRSTHWSSGTSHSTPAVAGFAALVREWYRQKKGGGSAVPSPALTKAIIVELGDRSRRRRRRRRRRQHERARPGPGLGPAEPHARARPRRRASSATSRTCSARPGAVDRPRPRRPGPVEAGARHARLHRRVRPDDRQQLRQRPQPRRGLERTGTFKGNVFAAGRVRGRRHRRPAQQPRVGLPARGHRAATSRSA